MVAGLAGPAVLAATGTISGRVTPAAAVRKVWAIDRTTGSFMVVQAKKYPGRFDPATGAYRIEDLPLDKTYDLIVEYRGGRLEGVNLKVPPSDDEDDQPLTEEDIRTIKTKLARMNSFEDRVQILALRGNAQHAALLVHKLRTKPFYGSKPGEIIWRLEVWRFEKPEDTWAKEQGELYDQLYRERIPRAEFAKLCLTFDESLGGLKPTAEHPVLKLGPVDLPRTTTPSIRFRPAAPAGRPGPKRR